MKIVKSIATAILLSAAIQGTINTSAQARGINPIFAWQTQQMVQQMRAQGASEARIRAAVAQRREQLRQNGLKARAKAKALARVRKRLYARRKASLAAIKKYSRYRPAYQSARRQGTFVSRRMIRGSHRFNRGVKRYRSFERRSYRGWNQRRNVYHSRKFGQGHRFGGHFRTRGFSNRGFRNRSFGRSFNRARFGRSGGRRR